MKVAAPRLFTLALGFAIIVGSIAAWSPPAAAQFFWSPFLRGGEPAQRPRARPKPKPPGDDLPPIVPKQTSAPPPPDDRPYDPKLLRLAEILGAVHYLRELCGAEEGQLWRNQMKEILRFEGSTAIRRAKLVNSFNDGYRGYRRTYRSCTSSATLAINRFLTEGSQITNGLAKTTAARETDAPPEGEQAAPAPVEGGEAQKPQEGTPEANAAPAAKPAEDAGAGQTGQTGQTGSPGPEAKPAEGQAAATQEGAAPSSQASTEQSGEAEQQPAPRRKLRRARKSPPPRPGWFPLINQ